MKTLLVLYGGIGDTIMIYENFSIKKPDLIYANALAYKTLSALGCDVPIKKFTLNVSPKPWKKIFYLINLLNLYIRLIFEEKSIIIIPSFSKFWQYFPYLKINIFDDTHKYIPRNKAIKLLFDKCF